MLTYLLIDLSSVAIPFAFSFHRRLRFDRTWYAFWPAALFTAGLFIGWDILFTRWEVWGFNPGYLTGLYWLGLPVEEWLFFICIPYACVFTYHCLNLLIRRNYLASCAPAITWILIGGLSGVALWNLDRIYTSVTFTSTALFLLLHLRLFRSAYLSRFYLAYAFILIPFLLVNGILTGSFIEGEVVWYDDRENLALRVFTIPIEDVVYGMLLVLVNVTLYEAIKARRTGRRHA